MSDALSSAAAPPSLHSHFAAKSVRLHRPASGLTPLIGRTAGSDAGSPPSSPTKASSGGGGGSAPTTPSTDAAAAAAALSERTLSGMAQVAWKPILGGLSAMLGACEHEAIVQYILKTYQSFAATCGQMSLHQARDALLVSLCQFSLPNWRPSAGVGSSVMSTIMDAGWRVGACRRTYLTHKHILVSSPRCSLRWMFVRNGVAPTRRRVAARSC